ncbi:MAG: valine--tRNA ligase, partial [Acidimicrobiia bacterium]|nr:valine--tRNA ligase [Acidimicrobiia bacterium]
EKGTGIAMVCTFGDLTDVTWWRELQLPTRAIVGRDGRILADADWITVDEGRTAYAELVGRTVRQAQTRTVELLRECGALLGEPRPITHPVKFFEKGDRPLEIVTSRQWYIRNGGRDAAIQTQMLERGRELAWHPGFMHHRYENWVEGLTGDWLISRQRFFGVPIPLWYRLDADANPLYDDPIVPDEASLPIDPSSDTPPGFDADQRGKPGGFMGEPDVMDTWATSSLSPQIAGRWEDDADLFGRIFPMDVRPQAHEIIRTWLFSTVVRAHFEHGSLPWRNTALSGWILDPDRKKMSKSKGNVVTPMGLFDTYGSDAVRYWAASARPGVDTAFDEGQMKIGRKLANKVLNVSRFVLGTGAGEARDRSADVSEPLDRALLGGLAELVADATASFESFDYARALERSEAFFWDFCDNYVELAKGRAYGALGEAPAASARATLALALETQLRLLAPFLPFVAEEVWSWWRPGSIHRASWPTASEVGTNATGEAGADGLAVYHSAVQVLAEVRKAKTEAKRSLRTPVERAVVHAPAGMLAAIRSASADLIEAGSIAQFDLVESTDGLRVDVELGPDPKKG